MGTYLTYCLPKGKAEHSGELEDGLQLLLRTRKATVRSVILLAALLPLALLLALCGKVFFWVGLALLAANCGLWLARKWMKSPWAVSAKLHQVIVPEYIRTLTLPCYDRMDMTPTGTVWSRIFWCITGGLLGFFLGALAFPLLIPYRLWADINLLMLRLPEFIAYFQEAIERKEREEQEKEKQFEKKVAYYIGYTPFGGNCESKNDEETTMLALPVKENM